MYAVIEVGGCQLKVSPESMIKIPRVRDEVGRKIKLDKILLISNGDKLEIGKHYLEGKSFDAEIVRHGKEKKITVFKKKRRKKYRRKRGHRQQFTEIKIDTLVAS